MFKSWTVSKSLPCKATKHCFCLWLYFGSFIILPIGPLAARICSSIAIGHSFSLLLLSHWGNWNFSPTVWHLDNHVKNLKRPKDRSRDFWGIDSFSKLSLTLCTKCPTVFAVLTHKLGVIHFRFSISFVYIQTYIPNSDWTQMNLEWTSTNGWSLPQNFPQLFLIPFLCSSMSLLCPLRRCSVLLYLVHTHRQTDQS